MLSLRGCGSTSWLVGSQSWALFRIVSVFTYSTLNCVVIWLGHFLYITKVKQLAYEHNKNNEYMSGFVKLLLYKNHKGKRL